MIYPITPFSDTVYQNVYRSRIFSDVFPSVEEFVANYKELKIPGKLTDEQLTTIYFLLLGKYANSNFAGTNESQTRFRFWGLVFAYGPTFIKKIEIQEKLRALTEPEIFAGPESTYNRALNPTAKQKNDGSKIDFVNEQNASFYKKSKIEGYSNLYAILDDGITEEFLERFKILFIFSALGSGRLYFDECEENENE